MSSANPLTVMDFEIAELAGLSDFDDQGECELRRRESDLREARAAVAELIEAAIDAHDFAANTARNEGKELDRRFYRLRAALARVGGA